MSYKKGLSRSPKLLLKHRTKIYFSKELRPSIGPWNKQCPEFSAWRPRRLPYFLIWSSVCLLASSALKDTSLSRKNKMQLERCRSRSFCLPLLKVSIHAQKARGFSRTLKYIFYWTTLKIHPRFNFCRS